MKELELRKQDDTHIVDEQKKTRTLIDQKRLVPGMTLFEYNAETRKLQKATFKTASVMIAHSAVKGSETTTVHTVDVKDDCMYFQALNMKNAIRKLANAGFPVIP
jgi:hypothetical protein